MAVKRKLLFPCIFILPIFVLFLTCNDPASPFSNNLGEKVVVEPPTISDIKPVSGDFLTGEVVFTGTAKAYIEVKKVEVYVYRNDETGQKEIPWTDKGITLVGGLKNKEWSYRFDTEDYNN